LCFKELFERKRPQLGALVHDARKRLFDVVLVWKFDRFASALHSPFRSGIEIDEYQLDPVGSRVVHA